jgi:hypothetical protein
MTAESGDKVLEADDLLRLKFPGWPSAPGRLRSNDVSSVLSLVGDAALILFALAFAG